MNAMPETDVKNVLIPTNFTRCAENAMTFAAHLLQHTPVHLTLLNAFESDGRSSESYREIFDSRQDQLNQVTSRAKQMLPDGSTVTNRLHEGKVGFVGADVIEREQIDLMVMGTDGEPTEAANISALGTGFSNTSRLLTHLDANFLVVPNHVKYRPITKVLITTDLKTPISQEQATTINWLTAQSEAEVHFGHISRNSTEVDTVAKRFLDEARDRLEADRCDFHQVRCDEVLEGIYKLANSIEADLIVAFHHHRIFHERLTEASTTKNMVENLQYPMLILTD